MPTKEQKDPTYGRARIPHPHDSGERANRAGQNADTADSEKVNPATTKRRGPKTQAAIPDGETANVGKPEVGSDAGGDKTYEPEDIFSMFTKKKAQGSPAKAQAMAGVKKKSTKKQGGADDEGNADPEYGA